MKNACEALCLSVLLLTCASTDAVNINPRGLGQVLLFPYYTVRGGAGLPGGADAYNTLMVVTNTTADIKAMRIWFRESRNGRAVAVLNALLAPYDCRR
jgi:hypothetical protein